MYILTDLIVSELQCHLNEPVWTDAHLLDVSLPKHVVMQDVEFKVRNALLYGYECSVNTRYSLRGAKSIL